MQSDEFFNGTQQKRLADLMDRWRAARDQGMPFSEAERAELEQLTADELQAATRRASVLLNKSSLFECEELPNRPTFGQSN